MGKKLLSAILSAIMLASAAVPAASALTCKPEESVAEQDYTVKKISNPDKGEREVDGLVEGGDRENSYTWRLAMRGDEIYIATTRNIASALVNMYGSAFGEAGISLDTFWDLINVVTNGDIPRNDANEGANIISYNRVTGKFKVIYTADTADYFRMAVTFGDDVYFGSYSAVPTNPQYILKLDTEGNFTKVFETMGSVSLRANCEYDGHLFFAGADDREVVAEGDGTPTKMAVLCKSNEDDSVWERVADYKDFGLIPYDPIMSSWAGAPIWELANHNGYIYATAPSHAGFVIFKGHPAVEGETANEYGWYWEEVAGLNNGINNPGLSDVEGGEPGTMRSLIGSVYEFEGELYAYNFDHSFGGEASAFAGALQQLAGQDVKASDYLFYLYDSLHNPQKIWKLNDETGKFEELKAFTELMEGTTNEYVWRLGDYDGDLYVATMDAGIFYNYLTQLTNGSFRDMSKEEIKQKIGYINKLVKGLALSKLKSIDTSKLCEKLVNIKNMLNGLLSLNVDPTNIKEYMQKYSTAMEELCAAIAQMRSGLDDESLEEMTNTILTDEIIEQLLNGEITIEDIVFGDTDVSGFVPEELSEEQNEELVDELKIIVSIEIEFGVDTISCEEIQAAIAGQKEKIEEMQAAIAGEKEKIKGIIKNYLTQAYQKIEAKSKELFEKIDWKGFEMYMYINNAVKNDEWGFDLLRTSDNGESFEVITRTGFDDKYNYGCPSFLATEEGLYIGTCNPFYGGQLYLLTNKKGSEPDPEPVPSGIFGDVNMDGVVNINDSSAIQLYLANLEQFDELQLILGDVDADGVVNVNDVSMIQLYLAELGDDAGRIGDPYYPAAE